MLPPFIDLSPPSSNFEEPPPPSQHLWKILPKITQKIMTVRLNQEGAKQKDTYQKQLTNQS